MRLVFFLILLIYNLSHSYSFPLNSSHQNEFCMSVNIYQSCRFYTDEQAFSRGNFKALNSNKFSLLFGATVA